MVLTIFKMIATSGFLTALECTKFLQRSLRPPSWFKGAYFLGEGKEIKGKGRGEEEREGTSPLRAFLHLPLNCAF